MEDWKNYTDKEND